MNVERFGIAARWQKAGLLVAAIGLALVTSGCGGGDDDGGGGGAPGYAPPPTARPTFTGMTVAIDLSGGSASAGAGSGGGSLNAYVSDGRLATGNGGDRAGINANFLTAAVLLDNLVTYAELIAIDPNVTNVSGGVTDITLINQDFWLPAGVTLNLGGAAGTESQVVIRTQGAGDYIRLDGNVVTTRGANAAMNLSLISNYAVGPAITIDGTITLDAGAGQAAGDLSADAMRGSIYVGGTITSLGSSGATSTGGGDVDFYSWKDTYIRAGILQSNGGNGSTTGGGAGSLYMQATTVNGIVHSIAWGFRGNGGNGGSGNGGSGDGMDVETFGATQMFAISESLGGTSTSAAGGAGGYTYITRNPCGVCGFPTTAAATVRHQAVRVATRKPTPMTSTATPSWSPATAATPLRARAAALARPTCTATATCSTRCWLTSSATAATAPPAVAPAAIPTSRATTTSTTLLCWLTPTAAMPAPAAAAPPAISTCTPVRRTATAARPTS